MKVTKLGHCCLLIRVNEITILTDPGIYSTEQNNSTGIDVILITHEHPDHLHIESLKKVLINNKDAKIITNKSVGNILDNEGIPFELVEDGDKTVFRGVDIEGFGLKHALMYPGLEQVDNTGYLINNRLFYPGDAFTIPQKKVDVLALPVAGPWMKLSEAIDYARKVHPNKAFPVHDGILKHPGGTPHKLPAELLKNDGIEFIAILEGDEYDFD
jgi:L-ascorbate metabolism protein UlaG (beta-lactamase superfamily)